MRHTVKRLTALFIALLLALTGVLPVSVFAEDGDGVIDPVIAHPDPLRPQIVVTARFEGQSVPSEGEQSPAEGEDVEAPAEEEKEESTEGENDQPAEDETEVPAEQPAEGDDAQEPSPSGQCHQLKESACYCAPQYSP